MLYLGRTSLLHELHPHTKGISLILFFACALLLSHPLWLLIPSGVLVATVLIWRLQPAYRTVALLIGILFVMTTLMWALVFGRGEPLFTLGNLEVSREGLVFGVGMGMRLSLMIAAGIVYLAVTRVEETTWSLRRAGVPYRAAFALGLSFRLLPLFLGQARRIREAQIARGLDLQAGGPIRRARAHLPLIAPVLLSAFRRADRLAVALECRGFGSAGPVTSIREPRFAWRDALVLVLVAGLLSVEIWLRCKGYGSLGGGRMPLS